MRSAKPNLLHVQGHRKLPQFSRPVARNAISVKGVVAWFHAAALRVSSFFSGLSYTVAGSFQLQVLRAHRWGVQSLAASDGLVLVPDGLVEHAVALRCDKLEDAVPIFAILPVGKHSHPALSPL